MTVTTTRRLGVIAPVGLTTVLLLTGCGAVQPGTAVQVDDETISLARVDEVAADFCTAIEPQLDSQAQTLPNSFLRGGIAGTLALRSAAEQVAAEYGVEADSEQYLTARAELERSTATLPEDVRDSVVEVQGATAYIEAVQAAVGEQELDGEGSYEDFVNAGAEVMTGWLEEHEVEFDPSLNTTLEDGNIASTDEALSFAVSDQAKAGLAAEPNPAEARMLPATHHCGRS
jgi:hypothetical protein